MTIETAQIGLKKYFGYDQFRPLQEQAIQAVLEGKDTMVLMPTGGGKSMCFQIPAIISDGMGIVVSPLISLMRDQVKGLRQNNIKAAFLNSSLSMAEAGLVENAVLKGNVDLLYISPEKLLSERFYNIMRSVKINLFAIDEAHCISSWGHDFRPEYTKMSALKKAFPHVPIIALTATADKLTRGDILKQLSIPNAEVFIDSFDRPNLYLEVRPGQKRIEQIIEYIKERPRKAGIIYCLSRKNTEDLAGKLQAKGIKAMSYHAGMPNEIRSQVQDAFINDNIQVVCATVAFGMGIDKSNVRWVIHYSLPKNMEGYYQEIGRAGRDGLPADTLLFYSYRDIMILRQILDGDNDQMTRMKLEKLERMRQYTDAYECRRKVLLNYFSETLTTNCNNCDVCRNPPDFFNGTIVAQKALSAVYRTKQNIGAELLINILRGAHRKELLDQGYHKIKTYGAGREYSYIEWKYFIEQIINKGILEIGYDDRNKLKLTSKSFAILFGNEKVNLVKYVDPKAAKTASKFKFKAKSKKQIFEEELLNELIIVRKQLGQANGIPPYLIFDDKTLKEISIKKPVASFQLYEISGISEKKMELYGNVFLKAVQNFIIQKDKIGESISTMSLWVSYALFVQGTPIKKISVDRQFQDRTVVMHLAKVYELGADIPIFDFVSQSEIVAISEKLHTFEDEIKLKPIFDAFDGKISYAKIQFALAHLRKIGEL